MVEKQLVKEWMNPSVVSTTRDETIYSVAKAMRDLHIGSLVVVDIDDKPIGIITSTDIVNKVVAENHMARDVFVHEVMSTKLILGKIDDRMTDAAYKIVSNKIKKLPIVNDYGVLAGIITTTDISKFCAENEENKF